MSTRFDYNPQFSQEQLATLREGLEWWLEKHKVPPPRGIYWDDTLNKRGLGGHYNPLLDKVFLDTHQNLEDTILTLFHELHHHRHWLEGGAQIWLEKGASLWVEHVPRKTEDDLCDADALADEREFLKLLREEEPQIQKKEDDHNKTAPTEKIE